MRAVGRVLRQEYEVITATSAANGLEKLHRHAVDIVISDFRMPGGIDGLMLLATIKDLFPKIRRFLYTGTVPEHIADHIAAGTLERCIVKPAEPEEILAAIR